MNSVTNMMDKCEKALIHKSVELLETPDKKMRFLWGALSYLAIVPLNYGLQSLAKKFELIPSHLLNIEDVLKSSQKTSTLQKMIILFYLGNYITLCGPLIEEFCFREGFQKEVLERKVTTLLQRASPKLADRWQGLMGKCLRVMFTSLLFSSFHFINLATRPQGLAKSDWQKAVIAQVISNLVLGTVASTLQEKWGFWSALGAHMTTNMVTFTISASHVIKKG